MTQLTNRALAIQLAIIHTLIIPILLSFVSFKASIGWIATIALLHFSRMKFDFSEFNRVKTYYFNLIIKIFVYTAVFILAINEMFKIAIWLIAFYS